MSKKKINKRLDKLFEDLEKDPEAKQVMGQVESREKEMEKKEPAISLPSIGEGSEPFSDVELAKLADKTPALEGTHTSPSTMLSTAFRTDENNWATLKVVDELGQRTWGTEEQMLVKQVADQLSLALENARLFQEAQRRAKEMTALAEVAQEISATLELQGVLDRIAHQAKGILSATTSAVYIPDSDHIKLIAITAIGADEDKIKADPLTIGEGILGNIALKKVAEIANDASNHSRAITIKGTEDYPHEHLMAAPILSQNQLSGLLVVWRVGADQTFDQTELEFLESLAQQASIAVENARLFQETQVRAEELAVLNELVRTLSTQLNIEQVLQETYKGVARLIDAKNFFVGLYNPERHEITYPLNITESSVDKEITTVSADQGISGYIFKTRKPLLIKSDMREWLETHNMEAVGDLAASWLGVPLLIGDDFLGVMAVQDYQQPNAYGEHERDLLSAFASQAAIAIQNARLFKDAQSRAKREKVLREITSHIRATNDPEMIAKAAVRELGQALGVSTFIRLGSKSTPQQEFDTEQEKSKSRKKQSKNQQKKSVEGGK